MFVWKCANTLKRDWILRLKDLNPWFYPDSAGIKAEKKRPFKLYLFKITSLDL